MIVWLNGGFGAGKSTLAAALLERIPGSVLFDPEEVGLMLWQWLEPNDDFQDLPAWRELVIATALSLRHHHAETLVVPMSLINEDYREEIFGALTRAGEPLLHVFLEADAGVLERRLGARERMTGDPERDAANTAWASARIDLASAAAARLPAGTLRLRSDELTVAELVEAVLVAL
jgi:gluconate kinase